MDFHLSFNARQIRCYRFFYRNYARSQNTGYEIKKRIFAEMKIIFLLFFGCTFFISFSQSGTDNATKLKALQEKKIEYHKRTYGMRDGYRIKIHFGIEKVKAMEVKAKFLSKYTNCEAYDEYQQPNFVIIVGDFKTKSEAYCFLKTMQGDFPNAFIVKDKIRLGK